MTIELKCNHNLQIVDPAICWRCPSYRTEPVRCTLGIASPLPTCHCLRCEEDWTPRTPNPVRCPKCGSPYWNKARKQRRKGLPAITITSADGKERPV